MFIPPRSRSLYLERVHTCRVLLVHWLCSCHRKHFFFTTWTLQHIFINHWNFCERYGQRHCMVCIRLLGRLGLGPNWNYRSMRIMRLQSRIPKKTSNMPKTLLIVAYISAVFQSPTLNNWNVSRVKVENVVKLASRPVKTKRRHSWDQCVSSNRHHTKPIRNEPKRLTMSVPAGNTGPEKRWIKTNSPCRHTAPMDPPAMIAKTLSIKYSW